jgi:hypothetical protein
VELFINFKIPPVVDREASKPPRNRTLLLICGLPGPFGQDGRYLALDFDTATSGEHCLLNQQRHYSTTGAFMSF